MNEPQPEVLTTRRAARSADVTVWGETLNVYRGTCQLHNRPVRHDHHTDLGPTALIPCPDGAHEITGKRLVVVTSNVSCDGSCWGAVSDRCSCGCGGLNHGRAWMLAMASFADRKLMTEFWHGAQIASREVPEDLLATWRAAQAEKAKARAVRTERRRESEQRRAKATFAEWAAANTTIIDRLRPWYRSTDEPFLASLAMQVTEGWNGKPKPLTAPQIEAVTRLLDDKERQAQLAVEREAAKRPAPNGRTRISGRIVKVTCRSRDKDGSLFQWGPQLRMTVSCDGYAVNVSLPRAVSDWVLDNRRGALTGHQVRYEADDYTVGERWTTALKDVPVSLIATIERSSRDVDFGFGSRPASVQISEPESAPQREAEAG